MIYNLVRQNYALFNLSDQYICIVLNSNSIDKLAKIFPVNLQELSYGTAKDIPLLSSNLVINSFLKILILDENTFLLIPKDTYKICKIRLESVLEPKDFLDEFDSIYLIEGPKASNTISHFIHEDVNSIQYHDSVTFGEHSSKINNICLHSSFFGELGYLLLIREMSECTRKFINSVKLQSFNDQDVSVLVNEVNTKVWNKSVFNNDCPIEIGLSHTLDFDDEEFEFHIELNNKRKTNNRRLVAIVADDQEEINLTDNTSDFKLYTYPENQEIGDCLRTYFSNELNKTIGYALVDVKYSYLGVKLFNNKHGTVTVQKTPFFITKSNVHS